MAAVGGAATTILQQIEMATLPSQQGLNTALLSKTSPLLRVLQEKAREDTGNSIRAQVRYNRNKHQWYYGSEQLTAWRTDATTDATDDVGGAGATTGAGGQFAQVEYQWKNLAVNVRITEDMLVENSALNINDLLNIESIDSIPERDRKTIFNIFARETELMADDMSNAQAYALANQETGGSGGLTNAGNDHDATGGIHSIFSVLDSNDLGGFSRTALGTFQDQAGAEDLGLLSGYFNTHNTSGSVPASQFTTSNKWQSKTVNVETVEDAGGAQHNLTKELLGLALHDCAQGGIDAVDYIFCNPRIYVALEMLLEGQVQRDDTMSNIGFRQNMTWNSFGTTIMADPFIPTGSVIGINTNHTYLVNHEALNSQFSGFKTHPDRAVIEGQLKTKSQLVCDDRAKNFWIYLGATPQVGGTSV